MEVDNNRAAKKKRRLSRVEKAKISEGRRIFGATNDKEALDGAENLFIMNRQVLDVEDSVELMKSISQCRQTSHGGATTANFDELPEFGYSVDGTKLPRLPPFKQLESIIESCSNPFEKQLTTTDLSKTHNRLAFNKEDVNLGIRPFLNSLNYGEKDLQEGIQVTTYDSRGKEYPMVFKTWVHNKIYLLNTVGWNEFVQENQLVENLDWVRVWVFSRKQTGKLCFALDIQRFATPSLLKKKRSKRGRREGPK